MNTQGISRRKLLVGITAIALVMSTLWIANSRADAADNQSATPIVYIVTGENFPDALGVGPASALARGPILFVKKTSIPGPTKTELSRLKPDHIVIVGGTAVISTSVESQLKAWAPVSRIAGANRYETAALVSKAAFPAPPPGSGPTAAGAGADFASYGDPIKLKNMVETELGRLDITVPASGGVLTLTSSVAFEDPQSNSGSGGFTSTWMTVETDCTGTTAAAFGIADLVPSYFETIPMNASGPVGAGIHAIRLCGWANATVTTDTLQVYAARLSAVWTPSAMGGGALLSSGSLQMERPDLTSRLDATRKTSE